jgi:hypothetical protein
MRELKEMRRRFPILQENVGQFEKQHEITHRRNRRDSQRELANESSLRMIQDLSDKDLNLCSTLPPEEWSMHGERPYLWKELQFSKNTISTDELCSIINRSPYLRKLTLRGRQDTDAILLAVLASSHRIRTLEIIDCRGSEYQDLVSGDILSRIVRKHEQLRNVVLDDTIITPSDFYEVLQQYISQLHEVVITIDTREDGRAFLDACTEYSVPLEASHKEEPREFTDLLQLLPTVT